LDSNYAIPISKVNNVIMKQLFVVRSISFQRTVASMECS